MELSHARGATQEGRVMVERSDRMWATGEGIFQARVLEWGAIAFSYYEYATALKVKTNLTYL